jgi:hypothetical protein
MRVGADFSEVPTREGWHAFVQFEAFLPIDFTFLLTTRVWFW